MSVWLKPSSPILLLTADLDRPPNLMEVCNKSRRYWVLWECFRRGVGVIIGGGRGRKQKRKRMIRGSGGWTDEETEKKKQTTSLLPVPKMEEESTPSVLWFGLVSSHLISSGLVWSGLVWARPGNPPLSLGRVRRRRRHLTVFFCGLSPASSLPLSLFLFLVPTTSPNLALDFVVVFKAEEELGRREKEGKREREKKIEVILWLRPLPLWV